MPVAILLPSGPGSLAEWAPSAGTNWAAVVTVGDSASVRTATAGLRDRYTFEDLPAAATGVVSVSLYGYVQTEGPGGTLRYTLGLSGVDSNGATFTPDEGGYGVASTAFALAPGELAWTVARVNALEGGPDAVTVPGAGVGVSADAVWLAVSYTTATAAPVRTTATALLPNTENRTAELDGDAVANLPDDGGRAVSLPGGSALDIEDGFATQPAVEMDEEGF